ncbi:hypothetical protein AC579_1508 [Pseudocercospora musae]|uniref:non-specific serine/threonine protein kinase n=1 Tax=Pseudocercospora musae TaxID=113226 RepID=A0A139IK05_9PEZI|nr:hypothetical protein AC579_1508 [Pseudocercospora musae]
MQAVRPPPPHKTSFNANFSYPLDRVESRAAPPSPDSTAVGSPENSVFSPSSTAAPTPSLRSRTQSFADSFSTWQRHRRGKNVVGENLCARDVKCAPSFSTPAPSALKLWERRQATTDRRNWARLEERLDKMDAFFNEDETQLSTSQQTGIDSTSAELRSTSITELVGEAAIRLGQRLKAHSDKSERKAQRKRAGKPSQPNLFDKPETAKLTKFWEGAEGEEFPKSLKKPIVHPHLNVEPGTELLTPVAEEDLFAVPPVPDLPSDNLLELFRRDRPRPRKTLPLSFMDASRLQPTGRLLADQQDKARRVKDAQDLYETIVRNADRSGNAVPPYDFLELIGKGAFGRVYKCRDQRNGNLVAVKIVNIDEQDWSEGFALGDSRDQTIRDFKKEVSILQQLKDNNAKNVNLIHDAFDWHSQLWIVADYCTGGSVRTLMRPFEKDGKSQGLPEKYIIPIARELAIAMKSIHDLHIIHRDIKCANVYITEQGKIQLGDFGIVGVIDNDNTKRKTVIGTPHWMPREIIESLGEDNTREGYGNEVDIWSYGCTVYEMATGSPPYSNKFPDMIPSLIDTSPPQLEGSQYSAGLRDLVTYCLNPDRHARPSAAEILDHPYLKGSSRAYSTNSLIELIEKFMVWEHGGGSRASLWMASPADIRNVRGGYDDEKEVEDETEDWNFSTSDDFDQEFTRRLSQMPTSQAMKPFQYDGPAGSGLPPLNTQVLSVAERVRQEHTEKSATRGEKSLARLYDVNDPSGYQLTTPVETPQLPQLPQSSSSDLPLRSFTEDGPTRESMIVLDLDEADVSLGETATSTFAMHMDTINEDTIKPAGRHHQDDDEDEDNYTYSNVDNDNRKTMDWSFPGAPAAPIVAKRDTMAWKFPGAAPASQQKRGTMDWTFGTAEPADPDEDEDPTSASHTNDIPHDFRPHLPTRTATEPVGFSRIPSSGAMSPNRDSIRSMIDLDAGGFDPSYHGAEIVRPSTASSHMTDATSGDPFDLDDDSEQRESNVNRFSYHKQWRSEGGPEIKRNSHKTMPMHERGSSLSSTDAEMPQTAIEGTYGAFPMQPGAMGFSALEQGLGLADDEPIGNRWPTFSSYNGYETSPQYPPIDTGLPAPSTYSRTREEPSRPQIAFPHVRPPHPEAMIEGADDSLVDVEMGRSLGDVEEGLVAVSKVLGQLVGIEREDDEVSSDIDSGFDSNRDATEDEAEGLTARREKPRKPSPRLPAPQTLG